MNPPENRPIPRSVYVTVTVAALLLGYAAFDDITTDNDTDFTTEYAALLLCAAWLVFMTVKLIVAWRSASRR